MARSDPNQILDWISHISNNYILIEVLHNPGRIKKLTGKSKIISNIALGFNLLNLMISHTATSSLKYEHNLTAFSYFINDSSGVNQHCQ